MSGLLCEWWESGQAPPPPGPHEHGTLPPLCYSFCYISCTETVRLGLVFVRNASVRDVLCSADICGYMQKSGMGWIPDMTIERHEIESRDATEIADDLKQAYDRYCSSGD